MPARDHVEPFDQGPGSGAGRQQGKIAAVLFPIRAQLEQKQILDAERLDRIRPAVDLQRLIERRALLNIPQQDRAPQIFGRRHVQPEIFAVGGAQLPFQLKDRIVGKGPHVQIDVFRFRPDAVRAQGGPADGDDRVVDRRAELFGPLDQLSDNR